jgi:hypothetical protein
MSPLAAIEYWCKKPWAIQATNSPWTHIPALRNEVADRMDEIFSTTVNEAVKPAPPISN